MGGFVFESFPAEGSSSKPPTTISRNTRYVPDFRTFIYIMKHFPHIIPDISEDFITDRAESSGLSKAVLIFQIGWFCTNCVSRLILGLPLSLLEVSTAAHAVCTLLTYFIWWSKPLNIAEGTTMRGRAAREVLALLMCSTTEYYEALEMARRMAAGDPPTTVNSNEGQIVLAASALQRLLPSPEMPPSDPFRNHFGLSIPGSFKMWSHPEEGYELITMAVSPLLYGLVHFLAWNDHFPKPLERRLWRASTVVVTFAGLAEIMVGWVQLEAEKHRSNPYAAIINVIFGTLLLLTPLAYVLASGFLLGESFRQLLFLDPATYEIPFWSNYWPHFS
jgi:hypothetical protein